MYDSFQNQKQLEHQQGGPLTDLFDRVMALLRVLHICFYMLKYFFCFFPLLVS